MDTDTTTQTEERRELTSHEFLFGDKLDLTVEWIVGEALREGSSEGFMKAAEQLRGIDRFLLQMGLNIAAMRVTNTQRLMLELAENDEMRTAWLADLSAFRTEQAQA